MLLSPVPFSIVRKSSSFAKIIFHPSLLKFVIKSSVIIFDRSPLFQLINDRNIKKGYNKVTITSQSKSSSSNTHSIQTQALCSGTPSRILYPVHFLKVSIAYGSDRWPACRKTTRPCILPARTVFSVPG